MGILLGFGHAQILPVELREHIGQDVMRMLRRQHVRQIEGRVVLRHGDVVQTLRSLRTRRLLAASEAMMRGWGGIATVSRATGLSRKAISQGIKQLQNGVRVSEGRIRRRGGGLTLVRARLENERGTFWQ